jgi:DNA-binding MarR family transcriptional regulator
MTAMSSAADAAPAKRPPEAPSPTAIEAWRLFGELFWRARPKMIAIWRELGLNPPQGLVLRLLDEPRPMGELAAAMYCDNSNITGLIDRLEERGLVERQPAPGDRRVKLIVPTDEGERLRGEFERRFRTPPREIVELAPADQRRLRDVLKRALG